MFTLLKHTHFRCSGSGDQLFRHFHKGHHSWLVTEYSHLQTPRLCDANGDSVYTVIRWPLHEVSTVQAHTLRCRVTWPLPKINLLGHQSNSLNEYEVNASSWEEQCMQRRWVGLKELLAALVLRRVKRRMKAACGSAGLLDPVSSRGWHFLAFPTVPISMHSDTIFLPVTSPKLCGLELISEAYMFSWLEQMNEDMGSFKLYCSFQGEGFSLLKRAPHLNVSFWSCVSPVS